MHKHLTCALPPERVQASHKQERPGGPSCDTARQARLLVLAPLRGDLIRVLEAPRLPELPAGALGKQQVVSQSSWALPPMWGSRVGFQTPSMNPA